MPPMTVKKSDDPGDIEKDVEWVAKDDEDQVATGIVMVPDKVDLQNDFVREDQIREFAEQFENLESVGEAGGGVMHAVFPEEHLALQRNEVLDEEQTIGGETAPAGAWVQSWEFANDQLWSLVQDGILAGYSVGIDNVFWDGPYEQGDEAVDDVDVPPEIDEEELIWKLVDGFMREVSAVDIPAVPDAQILSKASTAKRLGDHLGNRDGFIEEAQQRGHSEGEAERLWEYLNDAVDIDGAGEPGEKSWIDRAKDFFTADEPERDPNPTPEESADAAKAGQTLSQSNQESAMAAVDANLDLLEDAGVEHGMQRFTDRDGFDFDLSEHDARDWSNTGGDGEDEQNEDDEGVNNAAGGDTPDDDGADAVDADADSDTTMSDDDNGGDDKSLAEKNQEQINELTESVKGLTEALTGPEPKTAEIEIGGETHEVPEGRLKEVLGLDKEADGDDVVAAIESLKQDVQNVERRVETVARQSGRSTQVEAAAQENGEDDDGLESLGKALS